VLFADAGGGVEEEGQLDAVRLGGGHRAVVALLVETFDLVFLGQRGTDAERPVQVCAVQGMGAFGSAFHNKNT
jgi:hypothetical protein